VNPFFVFSPHRERSQSKTITSHHYKALSVQQWQENCAFRQKTLYTLVMEDEGGGRGVEGGMFSGWWAWGAWSIQTNGEKQQGTPREKCNTKTVSWNINGIYLLTSYYNQQLSSGTSGTESLCLTDKRYCRCRGTWAWPTHTQTQKHTHKRTCESVTGQEQGRPPWGLQRTLIAVCVSVCVRVFVCTCREKARHMATMYTLNNIVL